MGKEINAVRYLRDKYDIMQKSLICQGISRPYLSNLENGKVEISHEMAYRISEKFNEVFASKGIDLRLDKEDLMNVKRLVTKLELNDELAKFEHIKNIDFEDVRILEERYLIVESPYEYARLNSLLGNVYYNRKNRRKAVRYLEKAFDGYISHEQTVEAANILSKLIHLYYQIGEFNSAKAYDDYYFKELQYRCGDITVRLKEQLYYNSALLNKKFGNYEVALDRLKVYEESSDKLQQRSEFAQILKANIYLAQQRFEDSEDVLKDLLKNTVDGTIRIYATVTLLEVYVIQDRFEEFSKMARSVVYHLEDSCKEMDVYVYFWLLLFELAVKSNDHDFIFRNMKKVSKIVKDLGTETEIKSFIVFISQFTSVSHEAQEIKNNLVDYYFKF